MTHKEKALQYFSDKFHCSQAVLAAFAPELGITEEQALRLGALMVLGLMYGQFNKDDVESRMRANKVNVEMMNRFAEKSGSYICNELLGCDIRTEEGIRYARENDLFTDFCPKMVANAVDVLEEIIQNNGEKE